MSRSIKVYRYQDSDTIHNIHKKLTAEKFNKSHKHLGQNSKIINYSITNIRRVGSTVIGKFRYKRITRWHREDHEVEYDYDFTISSSNNILIIHGKDMQYHKPTFMVLSLIIHNEHYSYFFYTIQLNKYHIDDLHNRIYTQFHENRMLKPKFKNANVEEDAERNFEDFSLVSFCATSDEKFRSLFITCTMLEPSWEINQCVGLANDQLSAPQTLSIKEDCSLSYGTEIPNDDWDQFVFELLIEVLP